MKTTASAPIAASDTARNHSGIRIIRPVLVLVAEPRRIAERAADDAVRCVAAFGLARHAPSPLRTAIQTVTISSATSTASPSSIKSTACDRYSPLLTVGSVNGGEVEGGTLVVGGSVGGGELALALPLGNSKQHRTTLHATPRVNARMGLAAISRNTAARSINRDRDRLLSVSVRRSGTALREARSMRRGDLVGKVLLAPPSTEPHRADDAGDNDPPDDLLDESTTHEPGELRRQQYEEPAATARPARRPEATAPSGAP